MSAGNSSPRVSLVVATLGRSDELAKLLDSLRAQTYKDFSVVIVDQNQDDRVRRIIHNSGGALNIHYLRSEPGLSRARNVGLQMVDGEIVAFPDDDCWYPPELLGKVAELFRTDLRVDGITCKITAERNAWRLGRFDAEGGRLDLYNLWRRATAATIFLRRAVVRSIGEFDETLGVGSNHGFGAGEDHDYLIRAVASGFVIQYLPALCVNHKSPDGSFDRRSIDKGYDYSRAFGRVLRKHSYPASFVVRSWIRSLGGALLGAAAMDGRRCQYHLTVFAGRVSGWFAPK